MLASKSSMILSDIIDCKLSMFKSASRKIKNGERLLFNYGSNQVMASVRVISPIYIQLRFDSPVPVKRGDRYIVRFVSPTETCGGGIILNISSKRFKFDDGAALHHFEMMDSADDAKVLTEIVKDISIDFPTVEYLSKKMNYAIDDAIQLVKKISSENSIVVINEQNSNDIDKNSIILSNKFFEGIKKYIQDILSKFHKENELMKGMQKEQLKSILFKRYTRVGDTVFERILDYIIGKGIINKHNELISDANFNVAVDDKVTGVMGEIIDLYKNYGFEPQENKIAIEELAKGSLKDKLKLRQLLVDLSKDGKLIKLSKDYYMHVDYYNKALAIIKKHMDENGQLSMPELRTLLETSRKYAILIMDYTDQKRITELHGLTRVKGANYGKI